MARLTSRVVVFVLETSERNDFATHKEDLYSWNGAFGCIFCGKRGCVDRGMPPASTCQISLRLQAISHDISDNISSSPAVVETVERLQRASEWYARLRTTELRRRTAWQQQLYYRPGHARAIRENYCFSFHAVGSLICHCFYAHKRDQNCTSWL